MRSTEKKICKLEISDGIYIITDGETPLISTSLKTFSDSTLLRSMRLFESNCNNVVKNLGIQGSAKDTMLDVIFRENILVETNRDLESRMSKGLFALYIADREKTILRKITKHVRRKAFRVNNKEITPIIYTNQSEAVHCILSSKKIAFVYSKKWRFPKQFL